MCGSVFLAIYLAMARFGAEIGVSSFAQKFLTTGYADSQCGFPLLPMESKVNLVRHGLKILRIVIVAVTIRMMHNEVVWKWPVKALPDVAVEVTRICCLIIPCRPPVIGSAFKDDLFKLSFCVHLG